MPSHVAQVLSAITRENRDVRQAYLRAFESDAKIFAEHMGSAISAWLSLYEKAQDNESRKKVLDFAYTAMSLHVNSMKLFLSGQQVAAGNLMRQVLETIALTYLATDPGLRVLERFEANQFSTKNAISNARQHAKRLRLRSGALAALESSQKFYSRFSHPSIMTIGTMTSFAGEGIYLEGAFDDGKIAHYRREVANRLKLAKLFPGFIESVRRNLDEL